MIEIEAEKLEREAEALLEEARRIRQAAGRNGGEEEIRNALLEMGRDIDELEVWMKAVTRALYGGV